MPKLSSGTMTISTPSVPLSTTKQNWCGSPPAASAPSLRLWTCQRFAGHFFGVHALAGQFNVGNIPIPENVRILGVHWGTLADSRYEGWGFGAGLAYGYALPIGKHWNMEFEIGAGALYIIADSFDCDICNRPKEQNIKKLLPTLTKASINIVYLF